MAKTLSDAQAKYARKTQAAAPYWKERTLAAEGKWAQETGAFIGGQVGPQTRQSYSAGVQAANYRPGDPDKWAANTRAGLSR